jgi:hypothetical protein
MGIFGGESSSGSDSVTTRRALLGTGGCLATVGLTGCLSTFSGSDEEAEDEDDEDDEDDTDGEESDSPSSWAGRAQQGATFADDFEDGEADGWTEYLVEGDGTSSVTDLRAPTGGSKALTVSQSEGGGTQYVVGTSETFAGWDGPWSMATMVHTTALEPSVNAQGAHIIPNYDPETFAKEPITFKLGVKGGGERLPITFAGDDIHREQVYDLEWSEDQWYAIEFGHDGDGGYTGRLWAADQDRPAEPNVRATGPVPEPGEKHLGFWANGASGPEFEFSYDFVSFTRDP